MLIEQEGVIENIYKYSLQYLSSLQRNHTSFIVFNDTNDDYQLDFNIVVFRGDHVKTISQYIDFTFECHEKIASRLIVLEQFNPNLGSKMVLTHRFDENPIHSVILSINNFTSGNRSDGIILKLGEEKIQTSDGIGLFNGSNDWTIQKKEMNAWQNQLFTFADQDVVDILELIETPSTPSRPRATRTTRTTRNRPTTLTPPIATPKSATICILDLKKGRENGMSED